MGRSENKYAGESKNFCSAEGIEIYSTMRETKTACADHAILSLKNILYRFMEDYRHKYKYKLPQFIATMNDRNVLSTDMKHNRVRNSNFMSTLFNKPPRDDKNRKITNGDLVRTSKYDIPLRKVTNPNLHRKFLKLLPLLLKTFKIHSQR